MTKEFTFTSTPLTTHIKQVENLIAKTNVFSKIEISIAKELVEHTLAEKDFYHFIFAEDAQKNLIGYSCYGEIPLTDKRFDLYWIAVSPDWQKQKIAQALLTKTEEHIKKLNGKYLYAETSSLPQYLAARNFYLKSGFKEVSNIKDFYKDGDAKITYSKKILL